MRSKAISRVDRFAACHDDVQSDAVVTAFLAYHRHQYAVLVLVTRL